MRAAALGVVDAPLLPSWGGPFVPGGSLLASELLSLPSGG